jgi:hypothetical protein
VPRDGESQPGAFLASSLALTHLVELIEHRHVLGKRDADSRLPE